MAVVVRSLTMIGGLFIPTGSGGAKRCALATFSHVAGTRVVAVCWATRRSEGDYREKESGTATRWGIRRGRIKRRLKKKKRTRRWRRRRKKSEKDRRISHGWRWMHAEQEFHAIGESAVQPDTYVINRTGSLTPLDDKFLEPTTGPVGPFRTQPTKRC